MEGEGGDAGDFADFFAKHVGDFLAGDFAKLAADEFNVDFCDVSCTGDDRCSAVHFLALDECEKGLVADVGVEVFEDRERALGSVGFESGLEPGGGLLNEGNDFACFGDGCTLRHLEADEDIVGIHVLEEDLADVSAENECEDDDEYGESCGGGEVTVFYDPAQGRDVGLSYEPIESVLGATLKFT